MEVQVCGRSLKKLCKKANQNPAEEEVLVSRLTGNDGSSNGSWIHEDPVVKSVDTMQTINNAKVAGATSHLFQNCNAFDRQSKIRIVKLDNVYFLDNLVFINIVSNCRSTLYRKIIQYKKGEIVHQVHLKRLQKYFQQLKGTTWIQMCQR